MILNFFLSLLLSLFLQLIHCTPFTPALYLPAVLLLMPCSCLTFTFFINFLTLHQCLLHIHIPYTPLSCVVCLFHSPQVYAISVAHNLYFHAALLSLCGSTRASYRLVLHQTQEDIGLFTSPCICSMIGQASTVTSSNRINSMWDYYPM